MISLSRSALLNILLVKFEEFFNTIGCVGVTHFIILSCDKLSFSTAEFGSFHVDSSPSSDLTKTVLKIEVATFVF
jgi:hypothetical protein